MSKGLNGSQGVFLGWFNVVSKEFKIVYFGCKYSNYNYQDFLAAMSSSRSDVVTQFVCVCFRVCFRPSPFFSFSVLEVSSSPKEF